MNYIDIVFDGAPSHESGRFVEVEDETGKSINVGEWLQRPDGYWVLRLVLPEPRSGDTEAEALALEWARKLDAAATRHDRASTEAERKAASRDINDLILDSERMVQIARAFLELADIARAMLAALFGWQLYGWTFDAKATFVVPGSSEHLYVNKVQRESMEAAWNRRVPVAEGSAEDIPSVFLQEQQGGQILSTVKTGGLSAQDAMQAIKRLHEHLGQEIDRAKTDCPAQRAVPEQESSAATRARDSVALEWARKLDAAAIRHDRASTEAERKAASRDINDLILDSERMVQIARALLEVGDIACVLRVALEKITHEHLQFAAYFEDCDWAAQKEARAAIAAAGIAVTDHGGGNG